MKSTFTTSPLRSLKNNGRLSFSRRRLLRTAAVIALLAAALAIAGFGYKFFFEHSRATPFSVNLDTTSVEFTVTDYAEQLRRPEERGLLASDSTIDLDVKGCLSLERVGLGAKFAVPCTDDMISVTSVQLSEVQLAPRTRVTLRVGGDAVQMEIRPADEGPSRLIVSSNSDSTGLATNAKASLAGEWIINATGGTVTLILHDSRNGQLNIDEVNTPLARNHHVLFKPKSGGGSALTGSANTLILPELPKDLEETNLGQEEFSIDDLDHGMIRRLSLNRNGKQFQSLHVEITGLSDSLSVYDTYSDSPRNEALSYFDRNSGKDRRLKVIALGALALALLTALTSIVQTWSSWLQSRNPAKLQQGDNEISRIAEQLEKLVEALKAGSEMDRRNPNPSIPTNAAPDAVVLVTPSKPTEPSELTIETKPPAERY